MISLIVAMNQDNVIGVDNKMPWHIPEELQHFKAITMGKPIIMGRKTFESIGRVLPGRKNIVITRNIEWNYDGVEVYPSLEDPLDSYKNVAEICVIGGSEIYKLVAPLVDKMYITNVDLKLDNGTAFFPQIDYSQWQLLNTQEIVSKTGIKCIFNEYIKHKK